MSTIHRLVLFVIRLATPRSEREWVVGDTVEEFDRITRDHGQAAARQWLRREMVRVLWHAPGHRAAARAGRAGTSGRFGAWFDALGSLHHDIRYAWRGLRRSPGFAAVAIATLAVGIGANTAMFAVVNGVLLKPLPFPDADRLMLVHLQSPPRDGGAGTNRDTVWSFPKYRTLVDLQQVFDETALYSATNEFTIARDGDPERVRGELVTDRFFSVLGVVPILGRTFTYDETQRAGAPALVMLGYRLWMRRYGAERGIIGRTIHIDGTAHEVIGVLPRGFTGLNGVAEVWLSLAARNPRQLTQPRLHSYRLIARRRATVSEGVADAAVRRYGGEISRAHDDAGRIWGARAVSISASRADTDVRLGSQILFGAVALVLLIACVNLTNLLLAKAVTRQREIAIRLAIGASRARILRQFIVDGGVLATLGALGGLAVAVVLFRVATGLLPDANVFFQTPVAPDVPRLEGAEGLTRIGARMIGLDAVTLGFMGGVTLVTAILVALVPAFRGSSLQPTGALKIRGADVARDPSRFRARSALVVVQIALALVLLTGAGLMVRSAARLQSTPVGISAERLLTARIALRSEGLDRTVMFLDQLHARLVAIPGVEAVAFANRAPLEGGGSSTSIGLEAGQHTAVASTDRLPSIDIVWASSDYFRTLGVELRRGRLYTPSDRVGQPRVVLVNEAAARVFWPNVDPVGRRVTLGTGGFEDGAEVVGVVSDVRDRTLETAPSPTAYIPVLQAYQPTQRVFIRSDLDVHALVTALTREVRVVDSNVPITEIKTMTERVGDAMWRTRVGAWLLSAFAGLALLLTATGIFGVMAQTVTQRTAEIGIRMALGARRRDVLRLVLGRGVLVTAAGLAVGVAGALACSRVIRTLLYGVEPHDPATFASVVVVLGGVALAACYLPARRATRVDAIIALRSD
jgi:putative ABC transport system permease protein